MFNHPRNTNFNPNDNRRWRKDLARWIFWTALAHPAGLVACVVVYKTAGSIGAPKLWTIVAAFTVLPIEAVLLRQQIGPRSLVMWANVMRFRRRWFTIWTSTVNARTDHTTQAFGFIPILGPISQFKGSVGLWSIRPPAGQTLAYVADLADVIAAHAPGVVSVEVVYDKPTDSKGQLLALFGDNLTNPTSPQWQQPAKEHDHAL